MSLQMCVLGSGSGGNATLLRAPSGVMLIDCGIGPRAIVPRLNGSGVDATELRAIVLTHADSDHFRCSWLKTIVRRKMRLCCHRSLRQKVLSADAGPLFVDPQLSDCIADFDDDGFEPIEGVRFESIHLAHDQAGSHGFVISGFGRRIGFATDLGHVSDELIERFSDLDLLAIESNYDPQMQRSSGRPYHLQKRITGGAGHLSNQQSFEAVAEIFDRHERLGRLPNHVVLLHRSRQCNCPVLLRTLFEQDSRIASRLTLTDQYRPTSWLEIGSLQRL